MKKKAPQGQLSWIEQPADQLSWLDIVEPPQLPAIPFEMSVNTESEAEFELRRIGEMAEKLGWPALVIDPIRVWPGFIIPAGETAWQEMLDDPPSHIGLVMLALHKLIQPLSLDCIDSRGLSHDPVEVIIQAEEKRRGYLIHLAKHLEWPHISYWSAGKTLVFGPGEEEWRKYAVYGCAGLITDAVCALERRLSGEPDRTQKTVTVYTQANDEDDDE